MARQYGMPNSLKRQLAMAKNEIKRLKAEREGERALWKSPAAEKRLQRGDPALMHSAEWLHRIMNDPVQSKCWTGLAPEEIKLVVADYIEAIERMNKTPLFRNCASTASARGNRCKLDYEHTVYLFLIRIKADPSQDQLAGLFGVDQSTVCRHLELNERVMEEVLPTPKNISKEIAACETDEERKKFMPGKKGGDLTVDGTRVPHVRPSDEAEQREYYTRKNKTHCTNTLTVTNRRTVTVHMSKTLPGSRNDIVMLEGLAETFPSMADPDTPEKERIRLIGDSGFQGSEKRLPGIVPVNPVKRTAKKELTAAQKEWNANVSKKRYKIENTYADMKNNQILRRPFRGTPEHFNRIFNIVAGLRNFVLLFKEIAAGTGLYGSMMARWREERRKRPPCR